MKKIFLAYFECQRYVYMGENNPSVTSHTRLVWAVDSVEAEQIINDAYGNSGNHGGDNVYVRFAHISEPLGTPD